MVFDRMRSIRVPESIGEVPLRPSADRDDALHKYVELVAQEEIPLNKAGSLVFARARDQRSRLQPVLRIRRQVVGQLDPRQSIFHPDVIRRLDQFRMIEGRDREVDLVAVG
jgi:hypothetical protein